MPVTVHHAQWPRDREEIRAIRQRVFVQEQNVAPDLEWDGLDAGCEHVLVWSGGGTAVATGRLQSDGKIGRMAVLKSRRREGLGRTVLDALLDIARRQGLDQVYLHAQTHAIDFYQSCGFDAYGPIFDEAGIPHQKMRLMLGHQEHK